MMRFSVIVILLLALSVATILEGAFYVETQIMIPQKIVIARFSGVTGIACILQCRNDAFCHQAASQESNCLFLKSDEDFRNQQEDMETVTLFTETKVKRIVGKCFYFFHLKLNI